MGFYSTRILPALLDMATSGAGTERLRREALAPARGRVLDIGFGTGGNVPFFPPDVVSVVGLDPNPGVERRARRRIRAAAIPIELRIGAGERLPFPDASFDTVVTTLVLCSVGDPAATLKEIRRVLAPGGRYLLLEHGLAPDADVQKWQHRLNPVNRAVFGCSLTRPIGQILTRNGFTFTSSREFFRDDAPKFAAFTTMAQVVPSGSEKAL